MLVIECKNANKDEAIALGVDQIRRYHRDSIDEGTTLPLYYQLAPNEMLVPHETLDKEFLSLAEAEGVADIEELNKILERAVNLKNFLKGKDRIRKVAEFVANHFRENVEPLGYKSFLVGVDREACAHYKHALDQFLPPEYSEVVYTGSNNDSALLKEFHLDPKKERQIRKSCGKLDQQPKILIVTGKLLTGFDAPVLYAMYLDKPMRDHTLLQAIANEARKKEQAKKSFEGLTYFVYRSLLDAKIENAEAESRKIRQAFVDHPNWKRSENALRELRKKVIPQIRHSQIGPARQHLSGIMLS